MCASIAFDAGGQQHETRYGLQRGVRAPTSRMLAVVAQISCLRMDYPFHEDAITTPSILHVLSRAVTPRLTTAEMTVRLTR